MRYAIETLEIEIARLRKALRVASETHISYEDTQDGYPPDFRGMNKHLSQLQHAIQILQDYEKQNPTQEFSEQF